MGVYKVAERKKEEDSEVEKERRRKERTEKLISLLRPCL